MTKVHNKSTYCLTRTIWQEIGKGLQNLEDNPMIHWAYWSRWKICLPNSKIAEKDDIIRYVKGDEQEDNRYFWGIGEIACHSQISKTFTEIGTWSLEESGKLSHVNSNTSEYHIVIQLNAQQLLVRSESDKNENGETTFEFTEYERIR